MNPDTQIGGNDRDFPSTCWSRFGADPQGGGGESAFETLAKFYWKPIYAYIRQLWAKSNEDAKDLTQDFFVWMFESGFVEKADRERGRFRAFVKVSLEHYLTNSERCRKRLKRGGNHKILALDGPDDGAMWAGLAAEPGRNPDDVLDEAWRRELLDRGRVELEKAYRAEGKEVYFKVFRDYFLSKSDEMDYQKVAAQHGITPGDVSNYLMAAKRRYKAILNDLVAQTVRGPGELQMELGELFGEGP